MSKLFKLGATVAYGDNFYAPFPVFTKNYIESAVMLKKLGYDTMEVHIQTPNVVDGPRLIDACHEIGIEISSIGTGQAYSAENLSITSNNKEIRRQAIQRLKDQIDLGVILKCPIIIGSMRGIVGKDRTFEEVDNLMVESMKELSEYAERVNGEIVIEAIDRFESDYLKTAEDVLRIINLVNSSRIMVHLDTYHMNLEESDWRQSFLLCKGKLGHMHLADNKRTYPGSGLIDFRQILCCLREIEYTRSLTIECYPWPDTLTALKCAKQHICGIMESISCYPPENF